jgi:peptide/nickel transport system permease protein
VIKKFFIKKSRFQNNLQNSVYQILWKKFIKSKLSMFFLSLILFSLILSIFGYFFIPDFTPYANRQQLEISLQYPGFKVDMLRVAKNEIPESKNFFHTLVFGKKDSYTFIPIYKYQIANDSISIETYTGMTPNEGLILQFHMTDVCFHLDSETHVVQNEDAFLFTNVWGEENKIHKKDVEKIIKEKHVISKRFLLGTDKFGRDVLSQLVIGARVSLSVGFIAVAISLLIGITLGAIAGYFGGRIDALIMWLINVVWAIPTLFLVIAITFALGKGFWQIFFAVGLTLWVDIARIVRGQIMSIKEKEFIEAAVALGYSHARIISKHILPSVLGPVIVVSAANFASAILIESGLSFLGIGIQPPMPSWGTMLRDNYGFLIMDYAYLAITPGIAIMLLVLSFMVIGNGLRDAIDVKDISVKTK